MTEAGLTLAYVLPITHTPLDKDKDGVEIPLLTKRRLGLDEERSWIITTELNRSGRVRTCGQQQAATTFTEYCRNS